MKQERTRGKKRGVCLGCSTERNLRARGRCAYCWRIEVKGERYWKEEGICEICKRKARLKRGPVGNRLICLTCFKGLKVFQNDPERIRTAGYYLEGEKDL